MLCTRTAPPELGQILPERKKTPSSKPRLNDAKESELTIECPWLCATFCLTLVSCGLIHVKNNGAWRTFFAAGKRECFPLSVEAAFRSTMACDNRAETVCWRSGAGMQHESMVFQLFLVFAGAAVLATAALWLRQALIVAYIVLGILLGPSGFSVLPDTAFVAGIAEIGIIFLLFLLGLNLHPQKLIGLFRSALSVTLLSSAIFALVAALLAALFGFSAWEWVIIAVASMFSSTIIGLKLLPTSVLHHQHTGGVIISILLLQDILAIVCLLAIRAWGLSEITAPQMVLFLASLPLLVGFAFLMQRWLLTRLLMRFDTIREYVFLLAIAWCLGLAELAEWVGLSAEVGAFIAGVAIAANPVSMFIAESLKPLRDFFLVLFFFALGAGLDLAMMPQVWLAAAVLAATMLVLKALTFRQLLSRSGETWERAGEIGVRLGQMSEFSLLISVLALSSGLIGERAAYLVQTATVLTFLVSPYLIVLQYPTPIGVKETLRRD